jgi:hypothetical protein
MTVVSEWVLDFSASKVSGTFMLGLYLPALSLSMTANPMQLGHNKLRIEDWHESAVDAVVGKDKAWSWIRVVSAFTRQAVAQVAVQWKSAIGSDTVASDDLGWSGFGLLPGTAGQQEVVAHVHSLFDGYEEQRALSLRHLPVTLGKMCGCGSMGMMNIHGAITRTFHDAMAHMPSRYCSRRAARCSSRN